MTYTTQRSKSALPLYRGTYTVKHRAHKDPDEAGIDDKEKATVRHNSLIDEEILKQKAELGDYSGAKEKTDPAEIALVKKLDKWIMPMLVYTQT